MEDRRGRGEKRGNDEGHGREHRPTGQQGVARRVPRCHAVAANPPAKVPAKPQKLDHAEELGGLLVRQAMLAGEERGRPNREAAQGNV